jgi:hypothetical protein
MIKVARAVHHAHEFRILHRDLKPGNIFLDDNMEPLVGDFGLAKLLDGDQHITKPGAVLGTPAYMAPEQRHGRINEQCFATDVYSLGVMTYELIVGKRPFPDAADSTKEPQSKSKSEPDTEHSSLDPALQSIIFKCLQESPAERYATAADLAGGMDKWLQGENINLPPADWVNRSNRILSETQTAIYHSAQRQRQQQRARRMWRVAMLVLIAACLIVSVSLGWIAYNRTKLERVRDVFALTGKLDLLDKNGRPRWHDDLGTGVTIVSTTGGEQPELRLRSEGHGLFELMRGLPEKPFEFEAELRFDKGLAVSNSYVGLYVGRSRKDEDPNGYHCLVFVVFRDGQLCDPPQPAQPKLEFEMAYMRAPLILREPISSIEDNQPLPKWRHIRFLVTPVGMAPFVDGRPFVPANRSRLMQVVGVIGQAKPVGISSLTPGFTGSDGMGVYVYGCEASVRNIQLREFGR